MNEPKITEALESAELMEYFEKKAILQVLVK